MDHCGWCAKMHPIMENVAKNSNFHAITFYQANGPELQASIHVKNILQKKITGYPTIFFLNQGEVIDIQIGSTNEDTIIKKLNKLLYTSN